MCHRVRFGVEFNLFKLQREMGVMLVFTADDYAVVMELGRQVVEFDDGKITEVSGKGGCGVRIFSAEGGGGGLALCREEGGGPKG